MVWETVGDTEPFSPTPTIEAGETLDIVVQLTPHAEGQSYEGQIHVLAVGAPAALTADLTGGTGGSPSAVRDSWLLYE